MLQVNITDQDDHLLQADVYRHFWRRIREKPDATIIAIHLNQGWYAVIITRDTKPHRMQQPYPTATEALRQSLCYCDELWEPTDTQNAIHQAA